MGKNRYQRGTEILMKLDGVRCKFYKKSQKKEIFWQAHKQDA